MKLLQITVAAVVAILYMLLVMTHMNGMIIYSQML